MPAGVSSGPLQPRRLLLPVATRQNAMLRYDEAAPDAPKLKPLHPSDAPALVAAALAEGPLAEVILCGAGDPLAEPEATLELVAALRGQFPELPISLRASGVNLGEYAVPLAARGLSSVTLKLAAAEAGRMAGLYLWVRPGKRTLTRDEGATVLAAAQREALAACREAGLPVTVEFLLVPGQNDDQAGPVAALAASEGAGGVRVLAARRAVMEGEAPPAEATAEQLGAARAAASAHLPLAEAAPCLEENAEALDQAVAAVAAKAAAADPSRPYVAVATSDGQAVNEHLGHARRLLVYKNEKGLVTLLEPRDTPPAGGGSARWELLANVLHDVHTLVAAGAGENPRATLAAHGIRVRIHEGEIEAVVLDSFGIKPKKKGMRAG